MAALDKPQPKRALRNLFGLSRHLPRRFVDDETGAITVEFVLWVPVFVLILLITVDASVLFLTQANLWSIARDTTRLMSTGLLTNAEAETYVRDQMGSWESGASVTATQDATYVGITISVPMADVSPFDVVAAFTSGNIGIKLQQHVEPR